MQAGIALRGNNEACWDKTLLSRARNHVDPLCQFLLLLLPLAGD
jgi:hypothetical protein